MAKWLFKILLTIVSLSFFISAIELDVGEAHNSFFDEYDTYVKTEQVSLDHSATIEQDQDKYGLIDYVMSHFKVLKDHSQDGNCTHLTYHDLHPRKLFLRNSVWRI